MRGGSIVRGALSGRDGRLSWKKGFAFGMLAVLIPAGLAVWAPFSLAGGGGGGNGCSKFANLTNVWCNGDFTTTSWNSGFLTTNTDQQACYTQVTNAYADSVAGGDLLAKESVRADESTSCSVNVGTISLSIGTHGGSFMAWKPGNAYYTVEANFTFNAFLNQGTYCTTTGAPYAAGQVIASDAMYDQSTGAGVGWSTGGGGSNMSMFDLCNQSQTLTVTSQPFQASFTTSTAVANGDTLTPRGEVTAEVFVSMPGTSTGSPAHVYSSLDFNNDGYGYVTLNSIWVY